MFYPVFLLLRGGDFYFHSQKCKNILLHFHIN
nr:MAG TPA: hypothetical protein [Bacteriophage sp.]